MSHAVAELRAAREVREVAEFVVDEMTKRAARAAQAEGLSVRQFATEAGISKSAAGRHLRQADTRNAYNNPHRLLLDELAALVQLRAEA